MTPAERQAYLARLGLVDWRLRVAETAATAMSVTEQGVADTASGSAPPATDKVAGKTHGMAMTSEAELGRTMTAAPVPETPGGLNADTGVAGLDWDELEDWLRRRDHRGAQRPVFGTGARNADLLIIGEAPGAQEDRQGLPFVGPAGKLLDRMLAAIGYSRARNAYITNICKFRPPNNRDPHEDEVAADWPVLERQIELMNPKLVVAVGRIAAQTLLGSTDSLGALRGRVHRYPQRDLPVIVTYHPAYLLRTPAAKAKSWADLKHILAIVRAQTGPGAAP